MGNVKIDSNMKLLIVLKVPSKFSWSSLQGVTAKKHTREQSSRSLAIMMFNCSHAQPNNNSVSLEISIYFSKHLLKCKHILICFLIIASHVSTACLE